MAQKLDANLNVIQETPIELELINGDLSIISKLDDEPNDVGGLTSTQLKAKFDEAGNIIKEYLNESLIPAVLAADATEATRSAAEAERVENELERVANENVRVPAETARIAAENIRIENEATRVASEADRIDAEAIRKSNEAQRIINENAREDLETGYVARAEAAAKRAEDAAADAENTVGGDYVTQEELDEAIGAIPTPDVYTKTETLTNDTKALFGLGGGAVPNDAFAKMSKGIISQYGSVYKPVTTLDSLPVGTKIPLNVNGRTTNFIIVHHGNPDTSIYDASCNGTWLLQEYVADYNGAGKTMGSANYASSTANTFLNDTYYNLLDENVRNCIGQVKLPYSNYGAVSSGANGLSTKVFLLSQYEVSVYSAVYDGNILDYFAGNNANDRIAYLSSGSTYEWWLRTNNSSGYGVKLSTSGVIQTYSVANTAGYRPAFIIPEGTDISDWGFYNVNGSIATTTEYADVLTDVLGNTLSIHAKQIFGGIQIATGSYKGTGTYGESNPNSLTFDFEPKLVIITRGSTYDADGVYSAYSSTDNAMLFIKYGVITWSSSNNVLGYDVRVKFDGNTVSWYTKQSNAECQANASSTGTHCYHYFAIG